MSTRVLEAREIYRRSTRHRSLYVVGIGMVCLVAFLLNIMIGSSWLSPAEVLREIVSVASGEETLATSIVWRIRAPMAVMALLVGAALAVAGTQMQTILNNPLASPFTLGVSAGAGFGATLAIALGIGVLPFAGTYLIAANAFVFALLTCLAIYLLSVMLKASIETIVLAGIALMFLFQALLGLLQYFASAEDLQAAVFWMFGSLARSTWPKVTIVAVVVVAVMPFLFRQAWELTALRLGDDEAESLGIDAQRLRLSTFIIISLLTAVAVSFVGTIGFIGLVGPHIARMLVGEDQRFLIPLSALVGMTMLSVASIVSKVAIPGVLLPIGIVTSLIGIPFFLFLMVRRARGFW